MLRVFHYFFVKHYFRANCFQHKNVIFLVFLSIFSIYLLFLFNNSSFHNINTFNKQLLTIKSIKIDAKSFSPPLSVQRLNRLFSILHRNEVKYSKIFSKLNVISFQDLIDHNLTNNNEAFIYFQINSSNGSHLQVKQNFIQYLFNLSSHYSFQRNS